MKKNETRREQRLADPEFRREFEAEAGKKEPWLALVQAHQAAGLT